MFGRKPRWICAGGKIINLGSVSYFETSLKDHNAVNVYFSCSPAFSVLQGVTLSDIGHFLKYGRPRKKRKA